MKSNMIKRMLSAVIFAVLAMVSAAVLSYFGGNGNGVYAAANKLQLEGTPEIYVQSGTESIVNIKVKNVSGAEIKGVNLGCGYRSTDTDYEHWISHSSKFDSTDPLTGYTEHSDRFDGYFDREGYADPNAVWDEDEEGYTIGAGKTADLWFKVSSMYEAPGTYDEWIRLGDIHTDWTGFLPVTILDEDYSEECPVKVVVYNPVNAAVTMGTSNNIARSIAKIDVGSAIDFGTLSLTGDTDLAARKTIYMRNTSTGYNGNIRKDEHGNSTDITLRACVSDPDDPYGIISNPFSASSTNLAPLPAAPMSADSYQYAMTDITLDAANYVEGTYTAVFRMSSIPHGVRVNGSSVHTNGIYTWPVKVTLRGTNPRIPKAPQNVTATPGNGQVELAWTAAAGEESYKTYHIYRRDGAEGNRDKANTAGFDWSQYEYIGSDTPDNEGQYFFVDGTAQNGKNYTYIITGDQPLQAYPAVSSTVKPLASIDRKLLAPEFCGGSEEAGGVKLEWQMNENYGGSDNDGSAMVDHFNIYRDGVLVDQISQSAVITKDSRHTWEAFVETPTPYQEYNWAVSAVSVSGVEGYRSEEQLGQGADDHVCLITGHTATVNEWDEETSSTHDIRIVTEIDTATYYSPEKVEYWRAEGVYPPDTSKAPLYSKTDAEYDVDTSFVDKDVVQGKTYTYTVRVTDSEGNVSEFYSFPVKVPTGSNWDYQTFSGTDMRWSVTGNGRKALLQWQADMAPNEDWEWYYYGSYKIYRNDKEVKTYTAGGQTGGSFSFEDDPGQDGTYVYRMDKTVRGVTIRGREYTFVRNTAPVDESSFLKIPSAPVLDVRVSGQDNEKYPILSWAQTTEGGAAEGYHIYRKDNGEYVDGEYILKENPWTPPHKEPWGNNRYITIKDAGTTVFTDKGSAYQDDERKGILQSFDWSDDQCPHEYYITAYNRVGESKPSETFTLTYDGEPGKAPANRDEYAPGKPTVDKLWVEWDDKSDISSDWDTTINGRLHVAWTDVEGSKEHTDQWTVEFTGLSGDPSTGKLYAWQEAKSPGATKGLGDAAVTDTVTAGYPEGYGAGDYGKTASVKVQADNAKGSGEFSDVKTLKINSFPRFRAIADNGSVLLQWTKLFRDEDKAVDKWEIRRRKEHGSWTAITQLNTSDLEYEDNKNYSYRDTTVENGWTYEYQVVPLCDAADPSVIRKVTPSQTASSVAPGRPRNLTAEKVNGEVVLSWQAPEAGTAQRYQLFVVQEGQVVDYWPNMFESEVYAPSATMTWSTETAGRYGFAVRACSVINNQEVPMGDEYASDLQACYPSATDFVYVDLTDEDIAGQAADIPGAFTATAAENDDGVTLQWTKSDGATSFEIKRTAVIGDGSYDDSGFNPVTVSGDTRSYTDNSVMPGVRYIYDITPLNHYNYSNYKESVYILVSGKNKDRIIADGVGDQIDGLPDPDEITVLNVDECAAQINQVKENYDALTQKQQSYIAKEKKSKLTSCLDKVQYIRANAKYSAQAQAVQAIIEDLPDAGSITPQDRDAVSHARDSYNALPVEARRLVDTSKLTATEKRLEELEKEEQDQQLIDDIIDDISRLEEMKDVTDENAAAILTKTSSIRETIDDLDEAQRRILDSRDQIEELLNKLTGTDAMARYKTGKPHDHISEYQEEKEASCSAPGSIACFKCVICEQFFRDSECATALDPGDIVIPVDESKHVWSEWVVTEPTCTAEGKKERACTICGKIEEEPISMVSHDWNTEPVGPPETVDGKLVYTYQCKHCTATRKGIIVATDEGSTCAGNHDWDWDHPNKTKDPTCSEEGTIEYRCKNQNCHGTILETLEIDPAAHDWSEWEKDPDATCTKQGKLVRVCRHNGEHREEQVINATGHNWNQGELISGATCEGDGSKKYTCTKCKEVRWEVLPLDKNAHGWGAWSTVKNPTYKEKGLEKRVCEHNTSHTETREIAVLPCNPAVYLSASDYIWNNRMQRPGVTVVVDGRTLRNYTDYTVQYAGGGKNVGQYAVTVVLKGDYPAITRTAYYRINPKGTKLAKVTKGKKSMKVKWKKLTTNMGGRIGGYQIQYSMKKNFASGNKTVSVAGYKKTSRAIKRLKSKKTYYVRIRTYKNVGGVMLYSPWSGTKRVKTK